MRKKYINFADIYGVKEYAVQQMYLFKYFVKSFGCRIASSGYKVPFDLIRLFPKTKFKTHLWTSFSIDEGAVNFLDKETRNGFIGKGDLVVFKKIRTGKIKNKFYFHERVSWLIIHYWYRLWPDGNLGSRWVGDNQHIYLGYFGDHQDEYNRLFGVR